jgi:hypothetical protein
VFDFWTNINIKIYSGIYLPHYDIIITSALLSWNSNEVVLKTVNLIRSKDPPYILFPHLRY